MFRRKPRMKTKTTSQPPSQPQSQSQPRREPPPEPKTTLSPRSTRTGGRNGGFSVRTRIARATGNAGRYACDAVRALPSTKRNEVILQATDGHQATCVVAPGRLTSGQLVPTAVLPSKQLPEPATVRVADGQWESTEGKRATDSPDLSEEAFPSLGDVLPRVGQVTFYETVAQSQRRQTKAKRVGVDTSGNGKSKSNGENDDQAESAYVVLGVDLDILRRTAGALGTSKLTLFIPVPIKAATTPALQTFVNNPIPVCPASNESDSGHRGDRGDSSERGIGVVMPLTPTNAHEYYEKLRHLVTSSEHKESKRVSKGNGHARVA